VGDTAEPMTLVRDPDGIGFLKHCPHCASDTHTLGDICPSCGRPYEPQDTMDALPFIRMPDLGPFGRSFLIDIVIAIVVGFLNLVMLVIFGIPRAIIEGVRRRKRVREERA
jgi:hypothetical protein